MGCDIHIYTEVKKEGKWGAIQVPNGWKKYLEGCLERAKAENNQDDIEYYTKRIDEEPDKVYEGIYSGRNYDLFAILANVRNGYGFAGCDTGDGFRPISMPKGLPEDISGTVELEAEKWAGDGHSHSYHTLQDLLDYDWKQETKHRGWVDEKTYKNFKETGNPYPHSGGVSGMNVVCVSNLDMDALIEGLAVRQEDKRYYTKIEWGETYEESAGNFVNETIPALQAIAEEYGVNNNEVRIVFWFDN
jgi:hypothetical protein